MSLNTDLVVHVTANAIDPAAFRRIATDLLERAMENGRLQQHVRNFVPVPGRSREEEPLPDHRRAINLSPGKGNPCC